jgi:hypothetical protein
MQDDKRWTETVKTTLTPTKQYLANLSIKVRTDQFKLFKSIVEPNSDDKILDVGVDTHEVLKDSNMFEKLYIPQENITAATIEDPKIFKKLYPKVKVVKIIPGKKLPFKNKEFDIAVSWATLEHVGGYKDQEFFLNELLRVGKKIFVTTPYRGCPYELHSGLPFVHWFPLSIFRKICRMVGKDFWATEKNLNPLFVRDIKDMKLTKKVNVRIYKMFAFLPSHLIITT